MTMIEVPNTAAAIIVSKLLEQYTDWTAIKPPAESDFTTIEARAVPTDDPLIWDVESRYV